MKHNEEFSSLETTTCVLTFEFAICKFKLAFMREILLRPGPCREETHAWFFVKSHIGVENAVCYMRQHLHGLYRQLFSNFPESSLQGRFKVKRKINFQVWRILSMWSKRLPCPATMRTCFQHPCYNLWFAFSSLKVFRFCCVCFFYAVWKLLTVLRFMLQEVSCLDLILSILVWIHISFRFLTVFNILPKVFDLAVRFFCFYSASKLLTVLGFMVQGVSSLNWSFRF